MKTLLTWIQAFAATIGGPGLFIIAFLDSSFLSLPEVNDILVITMVIQHPARVLYYAAMATAGSLAGCLSLYWLARRGGDALVRRRISPARFARAQALFDRFGLLALMVPAILPPPAPFKIFVLLSGVVGVRPVPFALAIAIGRGFRYVAIGLLAVWYGQQAIDFLHEHGRTVAFSLALAIVVGAAAWILWRRFRPQTLLTSAG